MPVAGIMAVAGLVLLAVGLTVADGVAAWVDVVLAVTLLVSSYWAQQDARRTAAPDVRVDFHDVPVTQPCHRGLHPRPDALVGQRNGPSQQPRQALSHRLETVAWINFAGRTP